MRAVAMHPEDVPHMPDDPSGMNELYNETSGSVGYAQYVRAALAVAVRNGVAEAASSLCLDRRPVHPAQPERMASGMGLVHHLMRRAHNILNGLARSRRVSLCDHLTAPAR